RGGGRRGGVPRLPTGELLPAPLPLPRALWGAGGRRGAEKNLAAASKGRLKARTAHGRWDAPSPDPPPLLPPERYVGRRERKTSGASGTDPCARGCLSAWHSHTGCVRTPTVEAPHLVSSARFRAIGPFPKVFPALKGGMRGTASETTGWRPR